MSDAAVHRTLIVANRTTATPKLVEEVERRAARAALPSSRC